jgi:hypothetical protein
MNTGSIWLRILKKAMAKKIPVLPMIMIVIDIKLRADFNK